jgi:hypothetical protein
MTKIAGLLVKGFFRAMVISRNSTRSALLCLLLCSPSLAVAGDVGDGPISTVFYTEFTGARHDSDLYAAVERALNGDYSRDGFLFRAEGTFNAFSYENTLFDAARVIDGTEWQGAALAGYQWVRGSITYSAFVGVDFQSIHLSPNDITNPVRGDRAGAKFAGEVETEKDGPMYFDLAGEFSTAFDTYFVRGRAGYDFKLGYPVTQVVAGPEISFLGDEDFDARRVGAFVAVPLNFPERSVTFLVAGGYQFVSDGHGPTSGIAGAQGPYFTTSFAIAF